MVYSGPTWLVSLPTTAVVQVHLGIPGHLPRHHFTSPGYQKMWFTLALAKILRFMTQTAPLPPIHTRSVLLLTLLINFRAAKLCIRTSPTLTGDFPLQRLFPLRLCMCAIIIRIIIITFISQMDIQTNIHTGIKVIQALGLCSYPYPNKVQNSSNLLKIDMAH